MLLRIGLETRGRRLKFVLFFSVIRFGEISPLGENSRSFGHIWNKYLMCGKILDILAQIFFAIGQIFIVLGKWPNIEHANNLAIWSHCSFLQVHLALVIHQKT